jgi:hypothetical protein
MHLVIYRAVVKAGCRGKHAERISQWGVGLIDWLGGLGLGFICRPRSWDGHLLQAAVGYRAQEMP